MISVIGPFNLLSSAMKKLIMFWNIADQCQLNQAVTPVASAVEARGQLTATSRIQL